MLSPRASPAREPPAAPFARSRIEAPSARRGRPGLGTVGQRGGSNDVEKGKTSERTFHVTSESSVPIDGQLRPLAGLAKGERVTVSYQMVDGNPQVTRIQQHKKHASS
jgi:hypothetical protein